jgi:hypothetical protein
MPTLPFSQSEKYAYQARPCLTSLFNSLKVFDRVYAWKLTIPVLIYLPYLPRTDTNAMHFANLVRNIGPRNKLMLPKFPRTLNTGK